jgi:hypothetical protein
MAKPFNLARIDSTQTIIGAQSLWKKVGGYCCLYYYIYYNPKFKLCTMCVKVARRRKRSHNQCSITIMQENLPY